MPRHAFKRDLLVAISASLVSSVIIGLVGFVATPIGSYIEAEFNDEELVVIAVTFLAICAPTLFLLWWKLGRRSRQRDG
ncbi:MAG: hypothetical protein Hens3KO_20190 [Henriciella sp.]